MSPNPTLEDHVRKSIALLVAIMAALAGLLSGCSSDLGTAAKVGNAVITQRQVDALARELTQIPELSQMGVRSEQLGDLALNLLVRGELGKAISAKQPQLQVPAADRAAALGTLDPAISGNEALRRAYTGDIDFVMLANMLGNSFGTVIDTIPVELNPRFGSWDKNTQAIVGTNQSLSTPWHPQR